MARRGDLPRVHERGTWQRGAYIFKGGHTKGGYIGTCVQKDLRILEMEQEVFNKSYIVS